MSGELEEFLPDVDSTTCPFCHKHVPGPYQQHVHGCSLSTYDALPQGPRSPQSKARLHENISQCRRKFRFLETPIRTQIVGSLKRLACNSSKMCPSELSSPPKRPLSPSSSSSKAPDTISRLDDSVVSMIFTHKKMEEQITKEFQRSKKRKPEPISSVASPLQSIRTDKRQRASPTSPPSLSVLTPGSSTPSPSLPSLPGTPETPTDSLPSSPTPSRAYSSPSTPVFPENDGLPELPDEPDFNLNLLPQLHFMEQSTPQIGGTSEQSSSTSPPQSGGVSQFALFTSPPPQTSNFQFPLPVPPPVTSLASKQTILDDEDESTFNFDSSPSYSSYSSAPTTSERDLKESADKLRFFILQHQQLLGKAEQLLGSVHTDGSKHSTGPWLPPEMNDINFLTRQLDQIAQVTNQKLQQIAHAAKIQEYYSQSASPTTPQRHPFQPVSLATHLAHYGRYERDFEFLVKTVQKKRATELIKRWAEQIVEPQ